jgi:hypothetical protein
VGQAVSLIVRQVTDVNSALQRYREALASLPESGGGGCHPALLGVADHGFFAGLSREKIFDDLRANVHGTRRVTDKEIWEAIDKAFQSTGTYIPRPPRVQVNSEEMLQSIMERGKGFSEADLWEASPIRIDWPPKEDATLFLSCMYAPQEKVFIGGNRDKHLNNIRSASDWIKSFEDGLPVPEFIAVNPLTGSLGKTKNGNDSYRADSCVAKFRFVMIEFDNRPMDWQIQFWAGARLPIVALVSSGNTSIHAWIRVNAVDVRKWEQDIEGELFDLLRPLGVDPATRNEARLARMPGHLRTGVPIHFRGDKGNQQRILFLDPKGGPIQHE